MRTETRLTLRELYRSWLAWATVPIILMVVFFILLGYNLTVPYQPFDFKNYRVTPTVVCADGEVNAKVTRQFTERFSYLKITETWTSVDVPGLLPGSPVEDNSGEIPPKRLDPSPTPETVKSPILNEAPSVPGIYRVNIRAVFEGERFGFMPIVGTTMFTSNIVTVRPCGGM